ncbi:signal peptide peptidase SppA [bacterium]|nr:signal peptide peptidase SppA [bacterium]
MKLAHLLIIPVTLALLASPLTAEESQRRPGGANAAQESGSAAAKAKTASSSKEKEEDKASEESEPAEKQSIQFAEIKLSGLMPEGPSLPGLFGEVTESLNKIEERLEKATNDDGIQGVVLKIDNPIVKLGSIHEIRHAIAKVRKAGKKVHAQLETAMLSDLLIASACDEITMPESGMLLITGLRAEVGFYKNLLDKLEIEADILRVGKFKSAAEPYTRTEMSPEFRQELEELLDDQYGYIVKTLAESRGLTEQQVTDAIDSGPHSAETAVKVGLIDAVRYPTDLEQAVLEGKDNAEFELVQKYGKKKVDTDFEGFTGMMKLMNLMMGVEPGTKKSRKPQVAVIYATGAIMPGRGTSGPFGEDVIGAESMVDTIRKANENDRVKAIVLRVNSPGGSALASDLIWKALEEVDKPFVVSMGDVAGSGGYYISMGADYIFVEPGTITGSIGVVGGKLAFEGLFNKLGITTSVVSRGKNSGALSATVPFSESERKAMQKMMNEVYEIFTRKAAEGRDMELARLKELAGGRIYSGERAVEIGLVDEVGTLEKAIAKAAELADLEVNDVEKLLLPKPTSPFEQLFGPIDAQTRLQTQTGLEAYVPQELLQTVKQALLIERLTGTDPRLLLIPYQLEIK